MQTTTRAITATCEECGAPIPVAAKGRPPSAHPACRDMRNDFDRWLRSVDAAANGLPHAQRRAIRKRAFSSFFHAINATFNGKADKATAPANKGEDNGNARL